MLAFAPVPSVLSSTSAYHCSCAHTIPDIHRVVDYQVVAAPSTMFARTPARTIGNSVTDQAIPLSTLGESTTISLAAQDSRISQATLLPPPPPELLSILPPHWNRIKPSGQVYLATENIKTAAGPFSMLPDELIVHLLEYLDILSVLRFGSTCKALWAFSRLDESLWRYKFIKYAFSSFVISYPDLQYLVIHRYIVLLPVAPWPFVRIGNL